MFAYVQPFDELEQWLSKCFVQLTEYTRHIVDKIQHTRPQKFVVRLCLRKPEEKNVNFP